MFRIAAESAVRASATTECIKLARRGLSLVPKIPDSTARNSLELGLLTMLGAALRSVRGFTDLEVESTYQRAVSLCRAIGTSAELMPVLWGLAVHYLMRGEMAVEKGIAGMTRRLAALRGIGAQSCQAHDLAMLSETLAGAGRLDDALEAVLEARALVERSGERYYEAEIDRIEAVVRSRLGDGSERVEACLRRAIAVAREQGAKAFERRAMEATE
jgi:predicted ATPase